MINIFRIDAELNQRDLKPARQPLRKSKMMDTNNFDWEYPESWTLVATAPGSTGSN